MSSYGQIWKPARMQAMQDWHPAQRCRAHRTCTTDLEHGLWSEAGHRLDVALGAAIQLAVTRHRRSGATPERRSTHIEPALALALRCHRPQFTRTADAPLLEKPRRHREREVQSNDHPRILLLHLDELLRNLACRESVAQIDAARRPRRPLAICASRRPPSRPTSRCAITRGAAPFIAPPAETPPPAGTPHHRAAASTPSG